MPPILWNVVARGRTSVNDETNDIPPTDDRLPHHIHSGNDRERLRDL